jgi:solute:Na+ symporter, SSS family
VWLPMEVWLPEGEALMPPQFAGFLASVAGVMAGSLAPQVFKKKRSHHSQPI